MHVWVFAMMMGKFNQQKLIECEIGITRGKLFRDHLADIRAC